MKNHLQIEALPHLQTKTNGFAQIAENGIPDTQVYVSVEAEDLRQSDDCLQSPMAPTGAFFNALRARNDNETISTL